jgi:hypothetical protein
MNLKLSLNGNHVEVSAFVEMMKFLFRLPHHVRSSLTTSMEGTQVEYELVDVEVPPSERNLCKTVQLQLVTGDTIELPLFDVQQFHMGNGHVWLIGKTPNLPEPIPLSRPIPSEEVTWTQ